MEKYFQIRLEGIYAIQAEPRPTTDSVNIPLRPRYNLATLYRNKMIVCSYDDSKMLHQW